MGKMKFIIVFCLASLILVQCQPTENNTCVKKDIEEMQKCLAKVEATPEAQTLKPELEKAMGECIPNFPSTCKEKVDVVEKCWKQTQLEIADNSSISAADKRKALFAVEYCLGETIYRFVENNMRTLDVTSFITQLTSGSQSSDAEDAKTQQNDACLPNQQQLKCITQSLIQSIKVVQYGLKVMQAKMECYALVPEPCRFVDAKPQDCQLEEYTPLIHDYHKSVQDCAGAE